MNNMKFPLMKNNILREDLDSVIDYLQQSDPILTQSSNVKAFESEWSEYLGVKYSVFVNSGSSANLLTMAILKIKHPEGGEVIVPPLTWVSDIVSVIQHGFKPIFVDINPATLAMNNEEILRKITNTTRAVFLTHVQGFDGLTNNLIEKLKKYNIPLIEDVCESHGATHNKKKLGTFSWISNFSFYYAHHMTTIEGGMICTNDPQVYQQLLMIRSHGMARELSDTKIYESYKLDNPELNPEFIFAYQGYNVRNTEIGAILGRKQLKRLDKNIEKRTRNFIHFIKKIDSSIYRTDFKIEGSSNYAFNLVLINPDEDFAQRLMKKMTDNGIEYRRGSSGGGNQIRQPYLRGIISKDHYLEFTETEHIHFYGFYIGNFPTMELNDIEQLCTILNSV
mgnify:CR=1 FL=1